MVKSGYLAEMLKSFGADGPHVAVSRVLARKLPVATFFVAFGVDYSASFAFLSGRK
jgi:hypothetical protein